MQEPKRAVDFSLRGRHHVGPIPKRFVKNDVFTDNDYGSFCRMQKHVCILILRMYDLKKELKNANPEK